MSKTGPGYLASNATENIHSKAKKQRNGTIKKKSPRTKIYLGCFIFHMHDYKY